jgi:tetratricopeptide (TPR) repeat protein
MRAPPITGLLLVVAVLARAGEAPVPDALVWRDAGRLGAGDPARIAAPVARDSLRLLYFTAAWCGPCKLVSREVFDHAEGRAELAHYDLVHVDLDSEAGQALSDRYRVATVPTFVVVEADGKEVDRVRGYRSRRLLLRDLARFRSGRGTLGDLQRRLDSRPDDPALQAALGLRHLARLDLDVAAELLGAGLAPPGALGDTLAAEAGRGLADLHRRRGEPRAAARVLEQLLRDHPDHLYPRATWQLLAECHAEVGDSLQEARALRGAARVPPHREASLVAFAEAAARVSWALAEAEAAARDAIALGERQDPAAQAALAAVLRRRGNYPEALLWMKRAVALASDDPHYADRLARLKRAAIRGD